MRGEKVAGGRMNAVGDDDDLQNVPCRFDWVYSREQKDARHP